LVRFDDNLHKRLKEEYIQLALDFYRSISKEEYINIYSKLENMSEVKEMISKINNYKCFFNFEYYLLIF